MDPDWISPEEKIAIINKTVSKGDTFVCLGDVGNSKYIPMINARNHTPFMILNVVPVNLVQSMVDTITCAGVAILKILKR